ncbi:unnamed protein product [Caenorhabditis auriculariae]|uniref:EF-hand domain-containing protein n=1 Tax=Caenorhabditis auriculariae TaxID=2777116 RepID=A0A8S1HDP1_9PELO|nr:unnamed protein product [Caenorhabditis auriculariae]
MVSKLDFILKKIRFGRSKAARQRRIDESFNVFARRNLNPQPNGNANGTTKEPVEPVMARGVCVHSVLPFHSATSVDHLGASGKREMHRQATNQSASSEADEFTAEELQEFAQAFKLFDKDGNNTMNIKELGVAMRTLGLNPTEEELLNMVNEYDVDGNGKIDFGEFCKMMKEMNKETDQELIRLAFKVFDKDGNGFITAQEFKHFMTTMGERFSEEEVDEIIREVDKDGDEQIDLDEFVNMVAPIVSETNKTDPFAEPPATTSAVAKTMQKHKVTVFSLDSGLDRIPEHPEAKPPKETSSDSHISHVSASSSGSESNLAFHVNDVPNIPALLLFGFQQMMICISGLLVVPYLVSNMVCAGPNTVALRVKLISATFVTSGVATILQTTLGLRLSILHGPSFAFLPALTTFANTFPCTDEINGDDWNEKILIMQGSLFVAVLVMPLLGLTGLVGQVARFIGPVTVVPLLALLTIGSVPELESKVSQHWISIVEFSTLILLVIFLEETRVPIPYFSFKDRSFRVVRMRLFGQFPYLIGIGFAWLVCWVMTVTDLEPAGSVARTDLNTSLAVLRETPWFQVPFPGHFGMPKINAAVACGFVASCIACMIESIGDYGMCARVSEQARPPTSSINRAFVVEGFGCMLAALMGVGTGVTTYAENIAVMHVTKVTSRVTMQVAGGMLIAVGVFTKLAALLATIPEAIIGGVLGMGISMIAGVALSNLAMVDLRISRNLTIMGVAIIMGCTIPTHFELHPLATSHKQIDDILNTLLKIKMLVGGVIAFVLDNLAGGASRAQRGFVVESDDVERPSIALDGYVFPSVVNRAFLKVPSVMKLPFVPSRKSVDYTEKSRSSLSLATGAGTPI